MILFEKSLVWVGGVFFKRICGGGGGGSAVFARQICFVNQCKYASINNMRFSCLRAISRIIKKPCKVHPIHPFCIRTIRNCI